MAKPTFTLAEELDLLEWDFSPRDTPGAGPKGIIPEPTSAQLQQFSKAMRQIVGPVMAEAGKDPATLSPDEIAAKLAEADAEEEAALAMVDQLIVAVAAVCSDSPNTDQIRALPYRAQQAFFGWIVGTFMDPKSQGLATS